MADMTWNALIYAFFIFMKTIKIKGVAKNCENQSQNILESDPISCYQILQER